ncbi:MAG: hypothetical protein ACKVTZ_20900 [Bacteroidia bacterium]
MSIINIKIENGCKFIGNRKLVDIINKFPSELHRHNIIESIFNKISSQEELILELKKLKGKTTPISILVMIKIMANVSLTEALPVFYEVMAQD